MKPITCARIVALCPPWLWLLLPATWRVRAVWLCVPVKIRRQLIKNAKPGETMTEFIERMNLIAKR